MTRLIEPGCRELGQHQIVWLGIALCCLTNYSLDPVPPRQERKLPAGRAVTHAAMSQEDETR